MTKRSRRVRTPPPDISRRSESDGALVVDVGENPAAIQHYIRVTFPKELQEVL